MIQNMIAETKLKIELKNFFLIKYILTFKRKKEKDF